MPNYNNNFPATYQPYNNFAYSGMPNNTYISNWQQPYQQNIAQAQPQYVQTVQNQQQAVNNSMIWVQGEAGAKAFVMPNNTTLPLWDSEAPTIYIKSVDSNGKPTMKIIDYTDRDAQVQGEKEAVEYVTINQFNDLKDQNDVLIKELREQVSDMREKLNDFKPFASNNRKGNNNGKSSV